MSLVQSLICRRRRGRLALGRWLLLLGLASGGPVGASPLGAPADTTRAK